jgi:phosphoserine phosphatase
MNRCFVFDLDGTLTHDELLPRVAETLNLRREIMLLTQLTISGQLKFEESFRLRFAILKSAPISVVRRAIADVAMAEQILHFIRTHQEQCFIITGNLDVWIQDLIDKAGCPVFCSESIVQDDHVVSLSRVMHKGNPVLALREKFDHIIAVGDGANDVPMFDAADIGIAYGGVHDPARELIEIADYVVYDENALCRLLNTL